MRVQATFNKLPGFIKMSSYQQIAKSGPGILMTNGQMSHIVDRTSQTFGELGVIRQKVLLENYAQSNGLIKEAVYVKMNKNTTRMDRLQVAAVLYSVIDDPRVIVYDTLNLKEDL